MIDIHSHIIPNIDDGSRSIEDSLAMLKTSAISGVSDIICTPHYREGYKKTPAEIESAFKLLKDSAKSQGIPVNLYLGEEIFVTKNIKTELKEKQVLTLNGTKFVLLEFDYNINSEISEIVYELSRIGYIPIVAHVNRYNYLSIDDVIDIKRSHGLLQVNADDVLRNLGRFGKNAKKLFNKGLVDFVASDIHANRENKMSEAGQIVKKKFGEDAYQVVFHDVAMQIIKG
ncbi:MAG: capsular biosynthesis protein [Clostridia bacterium]|nr:capsular biosynthesis protein [Clostridia bacterium]MBQ9514293.1 capsular biosynthesis protein [Clostridia bacterium]